MSETTPAASHSFSARSMLTGFAIMAVLDIGAAIAIFNIASANGVSDQIAYLLSGVGPLLGLIVQWFRARSISAASLVILTFILLSAAAALIGGGDSRLLIVKDSVVTGGFGIVCLASLLLSRPLMFHFGARFATDGTAEGLARWNGLWQYPMFRRTQYVVTVLWGVGFLVEAGLRIAAAYLVDFKTAYNFSQILPFVVMGLLITATMWLGARSRKAGEARRRALAQETAAQPAGQVAARP